MERLTVIRKQINFGLTQDAPTAIQVSPIGLAQLQCILDSDNHETRKKVWKMVENDQELFLPKFNIPLQLQRDIAYRQLQRICDLKILSVNDFDDNPKNIFTVHECVAVLDTSTATKMTVQFNLFGGTVLRLGTAKHRKILPAIDTLEEVGCFALTEVGYGNNAVEMECTSAYDKSSDEFIINTPTSLSKKFWITNGAIHAHWCVVFAQLLIDGTSYGVHPFLVRIRDANMRQCNGVTIKDMGLKMGSNGVDNAELSFCEFRTPRDSLLDSVSTVEQGGRFSSSVSSKRERFIIQTDQLLSGRLCLASMALGVSKACLITAVRYSQSRMGVGASGKSDTPIGAYQLQRHALIPLIAETFALNALLTISKDIYAKLYQKGIERPQDKTFLTLQCLLLCCATKPAIAWHAGNTASICRERCGGQGYLSHNLFGEYLATSHACMTAEGDNRVLWQKTTKELTTVFPTETYNRLNKLWPKVSETRVRPEGDIDGNFLSRLFARREGLKLTELQRKMSVCKDRDSVFDVWMMRESCLVQGIAAAFMERQAVDALLALQNDPFTFIQTVQTSPPSKKSSQIIDETVQAIIGAMLEIFGCKCVEQDAAWFTVSGELTAEELKKVISWKYTVIENLTPLVRQLVDCFNIPEHCLFAPIAHNWEKRH